MTKETSGTHWRKVVRNIFEEFKQKRKSKSLARLLGLCYSIELSEFKIMHTTSLPDYK